MRPKQTITVNLLHRAVSAAHTKDGLRALSHEKPIDPASVERYLVSKFGDKYNAASDAMMTLAKSVKPSELASRTYGLYERFRPEVPRRTKGWGAMGILDLGQIRKMAR